MAWLTGYGYRAKGSVVATAAGAQTLFPMKLLVGESSGVGGVDVHCDERCHDFPNDIRFTGADGQTKHDYWVESVTGVTPNRLATIWIEVATIPASGAVDFYMYYGKTSDSGESSGDNTFLFFEDVEQDSDGAIPSKWTVNGNTATTYIKASTALAKTGSKSIKMYSGAAGQATGVKTISFPAHFVVEGWGAAAQTNAVLIASPYLRKNGSDRVSIVFWSDGIIYYNKAGVWTSSGVSYTANVWYKFKYIVHLPDGDYDLYINDLLIESSVGFRVAGTTADRLHIATGDAFLGTNFLDVITVRKYVSPDPTWGAWISEVGIARTRCYAYIIG